LKVKINKSRA